jgi:hypothetical protein
MTSAASTREEDRARINYDGRCFCPVQARLATGSSPPAAATADDGTNTGLGRYHQDGDLIWARFAGSGVRSGWLVGTCRPDGLIDAAYCMVTSDGEAIAGRCQSAPTLLADGRVRLTEHWRRLDGSTGTSVLEEIIG